MNPDHYVPILRAKRSEWRALYALRPTTRSAITPLLEIPRELLESADTAADNSLDGMVRRTAKAEKARALFFNNLDALGSDHRFLVDAGHLSAHGPSGQLVFWQHAMRASTRPLTKMVPVVRPMTPTNSRGEIAQIVTKLGGGIALRVTASELRQHLLPPLMASVRMSTGNEPDTMDLVVDLADDPNEMTIEEMRTLIPRLGDWRLWTVAAGPFPKDLEPFKLPQQIHFQDRAEWNAWRAQISAPQASRLPVFGDYTLFHGVYSPSPPIAGTISLRYATDTRIVVFRGSKPTKTGSERFEQYHGHAQMLCAGEHFYGAGFSAGDQFIAARKLPPASHNLPEYWRTACINHHLETVVAQLRDPAGSTAGARPPALGPATAPPVLEDAIPSRARGRTSRNQTSEAA